MLKNGLLRWLLVLNAIVLIAWGIVLGKRRLDSMRAFQKSRAEVRGIYARRGNLSSDDAAFVEGFGARSTSSRTYADADVARLLEIVGRDVVSPDDRFTNPQFSVRTRICLYTLVEAKSYSEYQQALISERLPPFPQVSRYPNQKTAVRIIELMVKKFDNPQHRRRLQSAVDVALGRGEAAGR